MVIFGEDGYNLHLQFTPDLANDWKNAMFAGMLSSDETIALYKMIVSNCIEVLKMTSTILPDAYYHDFNLWNEY